MASRQKRCRHILKPPNMFGYRPNNIEKQKKPVTMLHEDYEAIRLADYQCLKHNEAAIFMNISQATFARIYESGRQKIAKAIVKLRPVKFEAGCVFVGNNENFDKIILP